MPPRVIHVRFFPQNVVTEKVLRDALDSIDKINVRVFRPQARGRLQLNGMEKPVMDIPHIFSCVSPRNAPCGEKRPVKIGGPRPALAEFDFPDAPP